MAGAYAQTVSGTVFQDTAGELLADGTVGGASNPALSGRTVRLFNAAGTQLGTQTTAANGGYTFSSVAAGTYYVAVDAPTVNAAGNSTNILLEQTYASAGTGNGGTAGGAAGFGPLCVGAQPGYTQQGGTVSTNTASASGVVACYGGRRGAVGDSGTALNDKEHVTRVVVGAANVTGVNFGFSPYVVTNVNDAGQGSIRQFALNAGNAATGGSYTMRVVPAVPTNASGGGGNWWRADLATSTATGFVLQQQANRVTVFNGTPHSNTNGTTVLNPMPGDMVPASTPVGNQGRTLGSIPRPDFMVNYTGPLIANTVMISYQGPCAGSATRNIALNFAASGGSAIVQSPCGQYTLEQTVMGASPDGALATTAGGKSGFMSNTSVPDWTGPVNVRQNYFVNMSYALLMRNGSPAVTDGLLVEGNYIIGTTAGSISLEGNRTTVRGNYVADGGVGTAGIMDSIGSGTGGHLITENSVINHGRNLSLYRPNETVTFNVITNARGAVTSNGAGVVAADSAGIRISRNTFGGNIGNAIDLNRDGVTIETAGGGDCPSSGTANAGMPRPRISAARLVGTTLTVSGFYCNAGTHTLEFYKAGSGTGDTGSDGFAAGEGVEYLGSLSGLSGGTFTNQALTVSGLVASDRITAISIRADGSTSEFSANVVLATGQLTLAKTWANAAINDAVTVSVTNPTGVGTPLTAVAGTANETDTGTAFDVVGGTTYTLTEAFTTGAAGDYGRALACTGNTGTGAALTYTANALTGTITIGSTATNVVCTFTNTLVKTDVRVQMTASPDPVVSGSVLTYTIVVNNYGPAAAHGTVLTDTPGAGLNCASPSTTLVCNATGGAACPPAPVNVATLVGSGMNIPTLPAGGQVTATVQCTVTATGVP